MSPATLSQALRLSSFVMRFVMRCVSGRQQGFPTSPCRLRACCVSGASSCAPSQTVSKGFLSPRRLRSVSGSQQGFPTSPCRLRPCRLCFVMRSVMRSVWRSVMRSVWRFVMRSVWRFVWCFVNEPHNTCCKMGVEFLPPCMLVSDNRNRRRARTRRRGDQIRAYQNAEYKKD